MLTLDFCKKDNEPLRILSLCAHCDDIEIGCGGTLMKILENHPNAEVWWVLFSSSDVREQEARHSAEDYLANIANHTIEIKRFRNGYFPYVGTEIKEYFETIKQRFSPDLIFSHFLQDRHQDHRVIAELSWNTFRDHLILQYEIAKYDGDLATPNFYCSLDSEQVAKKVSGLLAHYTSQSDKQWFSEDLFRGLMRVRGVECAAPEGYAEAFHARKIVY